MTQQGKPFLEGKFAKECVIKVAEIICSDKKHAFLNVSLSRITITRKVEEIGSDLHDQL